MHLGHILPVFLLRCVTSEQFIGTLAPPDVHSPITEKQVQSDVTVAEATQKTNQDSDRKTYGIYLVDDHEKVIDTVDDLDPVSSGAANSSETIGSLLMGL